MPLVIFGAAILLVSIILILLIKCCIRKCENDKKKPDVEITKIRKDDGEGGGAHDSSRDDRT